MQKTRKNRKLPPYDVLYDLVVRKGQSYTQIAEQYGVHFTAVCNRLKEDRIIRGESWPITIDRRSRLAKAVRETSIDAGVLRDLLREAYEERQSKFSIGDIVTVSSGSVTDTSHRGRRRYHTGSCMINTRTENMISVRKDVAEREGYKPCGSCCRVTVDTWAKELGVTVSTKHIHRLLSNGSASLRIQKDTATQLLRAIGEEPHSSVSSWKPRSAAFKRVNVSA